jgi:hypothetical protein
MWRAPTQKPLRISLAAFRVLKATRLQTCLAVCKLPADLRCVLPHVIPVHTGEIWAEGQGGVGPTWVAVVWIIETLLCAWRVRCDFKTSY